MMTCDISCMQCKKDFKLEVKEEDYTKWKSGTYIQHAFPYLSAGERELLISGICGDCFDKMFKE